MKKKLFILAIMVIAIMCIFAISVSAETTLKSQTNNAYGELSFFDESVSVGRTNTKYGYTPYIDAEGTTYARVVIGDGTTFYTFPTAYALSNTAIYGEGNRSIYHLDLTSLNSAMQAETGTNPGWTYKNVYRIELPYNMTYLNGGNSQAFKEYSNVIEIRLQPNTTTKDSNKQMLLFWNCRNLEVIHNLDTFVFKAGVTGGAFQNCAKLTNLTIGVSPDLTDTQDSMFSGCTALQSVNFKEAFPNLTKVGMKCFYQCTNLVSTSSEEGIVSLPDGVTTIGQNDNGSAFYECKAMKYLSLPASLTHIGSTAFTNCTALEFVDFNDNPNDIEFYNYGHFSGCTALKAVSLSDNITTLKNRMFVSCTSLQAVYLPTKLEQMNTNGNGQGPFCYSSKMYFVQEPFEVRDENGNFFGDSFVMPTKPDVYYMPENLSKAGGNVSSGTWFRDCVGLNKTIVMPVAFTSSTVVQMFRDTATSSNRKNVVYLGDMESIAWSERNRYISFIFANPADTDISSVTFSNFYNNLNNDCYFYFCSTGYRYTMAAANATAVAETKVENTYNHIMSPKLTETTSKATCIANAVETQYCFCTFKMHEGEVANSATGIHIYDDDHDCTTSDKCTSDANCIAVTEALAHEIYETLVYVSFLENGEYCYGCSNEGCTVIDVESSAKPLFDGGEGFSTKGEDGIAGGYSINVDAVNEYKRINGNLTVGIMVVNPNYLDGKDSFLDAQGKVNTSGGALQINIADSQYKNVSVAITGFVGNAEGLSLVIALYAYDEVENVEFIQSSTTQCGDKNVTIGDTTLYTVTLASVKAGNNNLSDLGDYVMPSQKENA